MDTSVRQRIARGVEVVEDLFSTVFGPRNNPFHQLGALTIFFLWVILVSGIYLFIFYDTTLTGAYDSLERISDEHWWHAGIMRSLHRYASAAAVVTMVLHLSREFLRDRYRGFRWFSWTTGVPLVWMMILFGITGYWLVWDQLGHYVALSTALLMDAIPIFSEPMARNFILEDEVTERFFTLMAFIHLVGLPVIIILGLWFHLLRIKRPKINPPTPLIVGTLASLVVLSVLVPAESQAPADLTQAPVELNIDWFYLALFPLMDATSPAFVWGVGLSATLLLMLLPWFPPKARQPAARVQPQSCSGCTFCAEDCPYGAIDIVRKSDGTEVAEVNPSLCASCGICVGSCPSSSPFRRVDPLVSAIEMPDAPLSDVKERVEAALAGAGDAPVRLLVVGCDYSVDVEQLTARPGVAFLRLICTGMMPPSMVSYALRRCGADGVLLTGCEPADCNFRLGNFWTNERLDRGRPPYLGKRDAVRVRTLWTKAIAYHRVDEAVDELVAELTAAKEGNAAASDDTDTLEEAAGR